MTKQIDWRRGLVAIALVVLPFGCLKTPETAPTSAAADEHDEDGESTGVHEGGIAIPSAVRDNLGITFAKVERRAVAATRRVPGQFELLPTARQEYRALLGGRIDLQVEQFQNVKVGDVLFSIDSPQWRQLQHEAVEAEGEITIAQAALEVARAHRQEAIASLGRQADRLQNLATVNVRNAELESTVSAIRNSLPRLDAETRAQETALAEAREHYASRLNTLSSVTGITIEELQKKNGDAALWRTITALDVRAQQAGVIEALAVNKGGWLEVGSLALTVVDPAKVRFHAEAPQADIAHFQTGQSASIVPPQGSSVDMQSALHGKLTLGLTADAQDRSLSLYVTPDEVAPWAKAGIGGYLEVAMAEDAPQQLAVPDAVIMQDGLEHVFYRRDPKNPDRAHRVLADLGASDGRWVVLKSGVKEGDEVVLDGAYALKLSGSGQQAPPGYHYHADGQLHKNH